MPMPPRIGLVVLGIILLFAALVCGALLATMPEPAHVIAPLDEGIGTHAWPVK